MHPGEIWNSDRWSARLIRTALLPLSGLYAAGWEAYLTVYRLGLKQAAHPHAPILCIGNLVAGGSGKTPVTLHIADVLQELGYPVVIAASGYGGPHAEAAAVAPSGPLHAAEWGDEPALYRLLRPNVPLVVGRRRVLAAELVHQHFPDAVMLMDDGFQHLPLKKDITIVLDDPKPANRWCLPAGPYREGRWNRRRADLVLPGRFRVETLPSRFETPEGEVSALPQEVSALCALGQPGRFFDALRAQTRVGIAESLPDHDPLTAGTLLSRFPSDRPIVVTAKDWVKLRERPDVGDRRFLIAQHAVQIQPAAELRDWLKQILNERSKSPAR